MERFCTTADEVYNTCSALGRACQSQARPSQLPDSSVIMRHKRCIGLGETVLFALRKGQWLIDAIGNCLLNNKIIYAWSLVNSIRQGAYSRDWWRSVVGIVL